MPNAGWIVIKRSNEQATKIIGIEDFYMTIDEAKIAVDRLNKTNVNDGWWDYLCVEIHE